MAHRLSPRAQADVDEIAYYVTVESGSLETADRFLESIYSRFESCRARQSGQILRSCGMVREMRQQLRRSPRPVGTYQLTYFSQFLAHF